MGLGNEKIDYSQLSVPELIDKLYKQISKWTYDLKTDDMTDELDAWADGTCIDVDAVTDELTEHIDVFTEMKAVCEEMLRAVCDKEFDYE